MSSDNQYNFHVLSLADVRSFYNSWDPNKQTITKFSRQMVDRLIPEQQIIGLPPKSWKEGRLTLIQSMISSKAKLDQDGWTQVLNSLRSYHHERAKKSAEPKSDISG